MECGCLMSTVSAWDDEKFLGMLSDNSCTTLWMNLMSVNLILNSLTLINFILCIWNFILCISYHNKKLNGGEKKGK